MNGEQPDQIQWNGFRSGFGEGQVCQLNNNCVAAAEKRVGSEPQTVCFWVVLSRFWKQWRSMLVIVKPETVLRGIEKEQIIEAFPEETIPRFLLRDRDFNLWRRVSQTSPHMSDVVFGMEEGQLISD